MSDAEDRTIPATPRRRLLARREGMIPPAALPAWGASVAVTILLFPAWWRRTAVAAVSLVRAAGDPGTRLDGWSLIPVLLPTLALVLAAAAVAIGVRVLVDGGGFSAGRVLPDLRRVGPLVGLRRILSAATLRRCVAGALWLGVPLAVASRSAPGLSDLVARCVASLPEGGAGGALVDHGAAVVPQAFALLLPTLAAAAAVGVARFLLLRRDAERRIRMTPEEVREETRDQGSPAGRRHGRAPSAAAEASASVGQVAAGGA